MHAQLLRSLPLVCLALGVLSACGAGGSTFLGPDAGPPADAAGSADAGPDAADAGAPIVECPAGNGNGTLIVALSGATPDVKTELSFSPGIDGWMFSMGVPGTRPVRAARYVFGVPTATAPAPLARTAYRPSAAMSGDVCIREGVTTTLTLPYAPIASSGKLWVGNEMGATDLAGFAPDKLGASGAAAASVAANTGGGEGFTFDGAGNLWAVAATGAPSLVRYPAAALGASGAKAPDVTITSPSFGGARPRALAFAGGGHELWVSVPSGNKIVKLSSQQLAATGTPTAAVEIGGIPGAAGIARDRNGNLFLAATAANKIVGIQKSFQEESRTGGSLEITVQSLPPVSAPLAAPEGLAFDGDGGLWVSFAGGTIVRLTREDLAGQGPVTVTPAIQLRTDVPSLPRGLAFDEAGGLWFAGERGRVVRLAPEQLTTPGAKTPERTIASPDLGQAGWFALFPAPRTLPIEHALP